MKLSDGLLEADGDEETDDDRRHVNVEAPHRGCSRLMLFLLRQRLLCRWGLHGWFLGNGGAVGAWVSCRKVDPAGGVADDGSALTDGE